MMGDGDCVDRGGCNCNFLGSDTAILGGASLVARVDSDANGRANNNNDIGSDNVTDGHERPYLHTGVEGDQGWHRRYCCRLRQTLRGQVHTHTHTHTYIHTYIHTCSAHHHHPNTESP